MSPKSILSSEKLFEESLEEEKEYFDEFPRPLEFLEIEESLHERIPYESD